MFSLIEQEERIHDVLMSLKKMIRPKKKTKCQSFRFEKIGITFKHSIIAEHIIGEVKAFDDNTAHKSMVS